MKVGVPLFVAPPIVEKQAELTRAELAGSRLHLTLRNEGNVHLIIQSIRIDGFDKAGRSIYSTDMGGKYVLSSSARYFMIPFPEEECLRLKRLDVHIETDKLSLGKTLDIDQGMCTP